MSEYSKKITIRVTPDELEFLKNEIKNSGVLQRKFFMDAIKNRPTIPKIFMENVVRELKIQGNNLNQITKKINSPSFKEVPPKEKLETLKLANQVISAEIKLWRSLSAFLQKNL